MQYFGGGRYDGLVEELDATHTPAIGFAAGLERLISLIDDEKLEIDTQKELKIYIATIGEAANVLATKLLSGLRKNDIYCEKDISDRSLKAQFKYADKLNAKYVLTIGDEEVEKNTAKLKNMKTGEETLVNLQIQDIQNILNI